jgi:general stress protein 26
MDQQMHDLILDIMDKQPDLTLATLREDGWPQATTVSYAHDGLTIYFGTGSNSQKVRNIKRCNKVSLTINKEYTDWSNIQGISMGAIAEVLTQQDEIEKAMDCLVKRFPQVVEWAKPEDMEQMVFVKITPKIISVLNYEKGLGHNDLVEV